MDRQRFKMTDAQQAKILEACKPVPCMMIGGMPHASPQQNANAAWRALGSELGFEWDTVEPIPGRPVSEFMAEPTEKPMDKRTCSDCDKPFVYDEAGRGLNPNSDVCRPCSIARDDAKKPPDPGVNLGHNAGPRNKRYGREMN